jgi:hypothetical protein
MIDKRLIYAFALGCVFCWWLNTGRGPSPSPFNPLPDAPQNDRPVLRLIAKAAKTALWFMLVAEEQPQPQMAQHVIGDDGYAVIDHARAF